MGGEPGTQGDKIPNSNTILQEFLLTHRLNVSCMELWGGEQELQAWVGVNNVLLETNNSSIITTEPWATCTLTTALNIAIIALLPDACSHWLSCG